MATYGSNYPSAQGTQGYQGSTQTPSPDANYADALRRTSWSPAPSSTSSPSPYGSGSQTSGSGTQTQQQDYNSYQNSPVTPSGGVNYQQTQRWSQPAASPTGASSGGTASAAASLSGGMQSPPVPQGQTDPFAAMGGGVWTGQGWIPRNHPEAAPYLQGQQPGGAPGGAPYSPYGPYPARPDGTIYQPGQMPNFSFQGYQPTQFNTQAPGAYMPGQLSQWAGGPNMAGMEGQQDALMSQMLSSGGSMNPQLVAQMKERQKQDALAMQSQLGSQMNMRDAAAGRLSGGANLASQRNLGQDTMGQILSGYRDTDIAAGSQNWQDQLQALQASEGLAQGRFGRANQGWQNTFQGQMAQEGLNQQGNDNLFRNAQFDLSRQGMQAGENQFAFGAQFEPANFQRDSFLAQQGLNQQGANSAAGAYGQDLDAFFQNRSGDLQATGLANQLALGQGGLAMDQRRLDSQEGMFDRSLQLDWANALNNMQMGRYGLGLNYAQLQQEAQNRMIGGLGF